MFETESSVANIAGMLAAQHGITVFAPESMYPFGKHIAPTIYSLLQQTPPLPQPIAL
jgi:hypothetical protein